MKARNGMSLVQFLIIIALLAILLAAMISSPSKHSQSQQVTSNTNYNVELLFMVDGMKMYRFRDGTQNIYFVDGRNSSTVWNGDVHVGKWNYQVPMQVNTVR